MLSGAQYSGPINMSPLFSAGMYLNLSATGDRSAPSVHNVDMRYKSLPLTPTPPLYRGPDKTKYDDNGEEEANQREKNLQIISLSPFTLPDDWIVEEKPRPSMGGRVDRVNSSPFYSHFFISRFFFPFCFNFRSYDL